MRWRVEAEFVTRIVIGIRLGIFWGADGTPRDLGEVHLTVDGGTTGAETRGSYCSY